MKFSTTFVALLLSTSMFTPHVLASDAQRALEARLGIKADPDTAKKLANDHQTLREYVDHGKPAGVPPKEYVDLKSRLPAGTPPAAVVAAHRAGGAAAAGAIARLTALGIAAPNVAQVAAGNHLIHLGKGAFTRNELNATVHLQGLAPPIPAPSADQIEAAISLHALKPGGYTLADVGDAVKAHTRGGVVFAALTQEDLDAVAHLRRGPGGAGAVIAAFNAAQLTETKELQAGGRGLGGHAIAAPTADQINAAVHLHGLAINYTLADLGAADYLLRGAGGAGPAVIGAFNAAQLTETKELQAGGRGLGGGGHGIAAPTADQINAAVHLRTIATFAGYTADQLAATVELMTGAHGLTAIPAPSEAQIKAAVALRGILALAPGYTDAQLAATVEVMTGRPPHLTAIAAPTEAQIKAAVALNAIGALAAGYTDAQLEATVDLMTRLALAPAAITQQKIEAAVALKAIPALAAGYTDDHLKGVEFYEALGPGPVLSQAIVEAIASGADDDIKKVIARAIHEGFGGKAAGSIPNGVAKINSTTFNIAAGAAAPPGTDYQFYIVWKLAGAAWTATPGRIGGAVHGTPAIETCLVPAGKAGAGGAVGEYVVFHNIKDEAGGAVELEDSAIKAP